MVTLKLACVDKLHRCVLQQLHVIETNVSIHPRQCQYCPTIHDYSVFGFHIVVLYVSSGLFSILYVTLMLQYTRLIVFGVSYDLHLLLSSSLYVMFMQL